MPSIQTELILSYMEPTHAEWTKDVASSRIWLKSGLVFSSPDLSHIPNMFLGACLEIYRQLLWHSFCFPASHAKVEKITGAPKGAQPSFGAKANQLRSGFQKWVSQACRNILQP